MNKVLQKHKVIVNETENLNVVGGGLKNVKPKGNKIAPRRPALGEVGNKLPVQTKGDVTKKSVIPKVVNQKKDAPAKEVTKKVAVQKDNKKGNEKHNDDKNISTKPQNDKVTAVDKQRQAFSSLRHIGSLEIDNADPFSEPEYREEIFKYLLQLESNYSINVGFLKSHSSTPRMRSILINWIAEVHLNFHFLSETLHLTVALIDRYLQIDREIGRENLQLVGVTALLIASKYEEMYIPDLGDFVYVCDNAYDRKEILQMELNMLRKLDFACLSYPTAVPFLKWFSRTAQIRPLCYTLGKYLSELALNFYQFSHVKPSMRAAAACCLSMTILEEKIPSQTWTEDLIECSTYKYSDIEDVVNDMVALLSKIENSDYQVIRKKYATSKNGKISLNPKLKNVTINLMSDTSK